MSRFGSSARWLRTRLHTIRVRLTLWYVALLALILVGFSAFLYVRLAQSLADEENRALAAEVQRVVATLDVQNGTPALGDALDQLPVGMVVALYDPVGRRLDASDTHLTLPPLPPTAQPAGAGGPAPETLQLGNETWRVLTRAVVERGHTIGILQVAQSDRPYEAALSQLALLMGLAIPLTLVLAVAGGLFFASRALGPIDRITRAAQRIGAEDLSQRLHLPASPDEVGRLATTFDQMLDRLDRAFQRQRQFTADASHELRTPLALLTSQADVALERPRRPAEYRQALADIHAEAQRMSRLLAELLTLARADDGREIMAREPIALDALVEDVVATMAPLAERCDVQLALGERKCCVTAGDQTRLTQLLVNLVDNAINYTPPHGAVRVSLDRTPSWAVLSVADTGVGIAPEHMPRLFERFYRADPARGRGGAGLGLAIADWIARAHGGRIEVESALGQGTTFTVWLPLTSAAAC